MWSLESLGRGSLETGVGFLLSREVWWDRMWPGWGHGLVEWLAFWNRLLLGIRLTPQPPATEHAEKLGAHGVTVASGWLSVCTVAIVFSSPKQVPTKCAITAWLS